MSKPGDLKDRILSAVSIESYIGRFVTLKKQGKYYSGLCPFHQEKSPSFTVTPEKGLFHCFGCGAGGDLFTFVMKKENVDFTGALEILSRYAGIEAAPGQRSDPHKERLYKINETAESMFRKFFLSSEGSESMKYMLNRGIKKETLEVFRIGASPSQWRWLSESLPEARSELLELGLSRENKGSVYDFYRGRVIFPIHDLQGRVAGFGGRILETASADSSDSFKAAKYVNSSESPVFSKSSILYGLWFGLSTVRTEKTVIITEGYLDVIGFHQSGIKNTVAPLGTSLTENHLNLIQRYADSVIIILDGDKAGRAAAYRSAGLLLSQRGLQGSVVILPEGMDPFDLSCLLPETAIRTMLKESAISAERFYLLETIWPDFYKKAEAGLPHPELSRKDPSSFSVALKHYYTDNLRSPYREAGLSEKKAAFGRAVAFLRSTEQGVNRDLFIQETAAILNVTVQSIVQELRTGRSAAAEPPAPPVKREIRSAADPIIQTERNLIKEILRFPQLFGVYYPALRQLSFEDEYSESLFRYLETRYLMGQVWDLRILSEGNLTNETVSVFTGLIVSEETSDDSIPEHHADYMDELILDHRIRRLKKQIRKKEESMVLLPADRLVEAAREQSQLVKELKELEKKKTRSRD